VYFEQHWERPYYALGIFSMLMAGVAHQTLYPKLLYQQQQQQKQLMNNLPTTKTAAET
jgi:hypothetical protein